MSKTEKDKAARTAILEAGKQAFRKWGRGKTTMEDIASEAGRGKSTLYYYYRNRDEIFDAVVRMEVGDLLSRVKETARDLSSARERLRKYIVSSAIEMKSSAPLSEIISREAENDPHFLRKIREQFRGEESQFLQETLNLGVQQNHFSFANDQELATTSDAIFKILACLQLGLLHEDYEVRHVETMARLIVNGI